MRACRSGVLALALVSCPVVAQVAGEHLVAPADPTMKLSFAQSRATSIKEYVDQNQTIDDWTRMVTVLTVGWRPGQTPQAFLNAWSGRWTRACPGAVAGTVNSLTVTGHAAAEVRVDCPLNPGTGKPETAFARVVLGDTTMHMIQAATRRVPTQADTTWAQAVIAGAVLCPANGGGKRCAESMNPALGSAL